MNEILNDIFNKGRGNERHYWGDDPQELLRQIQTYGPAWGFTLVGGKPVSVPESRTMADPSRYRFQRDTRGMLVAVPIEASGIPALGYTSLAEDLSQGFRFMREQDGFLLSSYVPDESGVIKVRAVVDRKFVFDRHLPNVTTLDEVFDYANEIAEAVRRPG